MKSQYLELRAIADNMYRLAQEAFDREKEEAIDWILAQMSLLGISVYHLESISIPEEKTEKVEPNENKHNSCQGEGNNSHARILLTNQTSPAENGVYIFNVSTAALERIPKKLSTDFVTRQSNTQTEKSKVDIKHPNLRVSINGVLYDSSKQACIELGLFRNSATRRCFSSEQKFKDWFFVSNDTGQPIYKTTNPEKKNSPTKGRHRTEEEKKNISEALRKYHSSGIQKKPRKPHDINLPHGRSFSTKSVETIKKISENQKGKKHSEETKQKIKLEMATRSVPRCAGQPLRIDGINYNSLSAASKTLKISVSTIMDRCKNKREEFKEWFYLPLMPKC